MITRINMNNNDTIEAAIDPSNKLTFLLDWELTLKCNLDCSYCSTGIYGGHDNSIPHPSVKECFETIDFMFEYVDLYMSNRIDSLKHVILNVYGGESLHHPHIVEILQKCKDKYIKHYTDKWKLILQITTNLILPEKKLYKIINLLDNFTVSFHSESTNKQREQLKNNCKTLQEHDKKFNCIVLMHPNEEKWKICIDFIEWCKKNNISYLPRQLDHGSATTHFNYNKHQLEWFKELYSRRNGKEQVLDVEWKTEKNNENKFDLSDSGRSCCGGRMLCANQKHKRTHAFVENKFKGWSCSVNEFFLYIKQVTGEIFVNKDCKMNFDGEVGPIGNIKDSQRLLNWTKRNIENQTMPVITCKKDRCLCGICAPKSKFKSDFNNVVKKYRTFNINKSLED